MSEIKRYVVLADGSVQDGDQPNATIYKKGAKPEKSTDEAPPQFLMRYTPTQKTAILRIAEALGVDKSKMALDFFAQTYEKLFREAFPEYDYRKAVNIEARIARYRRLNVEDDDE